MPSLGVTVHQNFQEPERPSGQPKLQIVSREPFSPVASFLLGMTAGLATAAGLFAVFMH